MALIPLPNIYSSKLNLIRLEMLSTCSLVQFQSIYSSQVMFTHRLFLVDIECALKTICKGVIIDVEKTIASNFLIMLQFEQCELFIY